jgi:hypothetical protein
MIKLKINIITSYITAILDKKKILDTDLNDDIFNKVLKKYEGLK